MQISGHPLATTILLLLSVSTANAQTIFVDTSGDVIDFGGAQQVGNLPGPDGKVSLAEAGLASDNTPGIQTIGFHIPKSDWLYQGFFPGRAVLRPFLGFRVFDTVILDGRTQTAFTGETNPDGGAEVVIWAETYLIDNVGGAVFGLDNSSIHLSGGSGNTIQANTVSGIEVFDSASNLLGGGNPGDGNTGGFVQIDRANDNVVVGNTVNRVRVLGWVGGGKPATNNRIGGPTQGERNFIKGFGTWNSEMIPGGFAVQLFDSIGTLIENNWIGTTPDGLSQGHLATTAGVLFEGENHSTTVRGNRIAGILGHAYPPHGPAYVVGSAIQVYGTGSGVAIVGNTIGLDANGQPRLGSVTGIAMLNYYLGAVQNVVIGGTAPGEGNEIAGHLGTAISVANTFSGVHVTGNSIHDNGGLGIDLITDGFLTGVTPNDPLDLDTGGNGLQNFPVLESATRAGAALRVVGTLNSSPLASFTIEFFASPQCDPSGYGEGQAYLGSQTVNTNAMGDAAFDVTLPAAVQLGWFVAGTATHAASASTSEFSACVPVAADQVTVFCTAKTNSLGCVPSIGSSGTLTLGDASPFVITAQQVLNRKPGILFYGKTGRAALPFLGGILCANPPLKRTGVLNSGGAPPPVSDCSGTYGFDFDSWFAIGLDPSLVPGAVLDAQFFSRDHLSSFGTGLTDAIEFAVTP